MVKPSGVGRRSAPDSACITYYVQWLSSCPLSTVQCLVTGAVVSGLRSTCRGNVRPGILQLIPALSNSEGAKRWAELDNSLGVPARLYPQAPEWEMTAGRNVIHELFPFVRLCFIVSFIILGKIIFHCNFVCSYFRRAKTCQFFSQFSGFWTTSATITQWRSHYPWLKTHELQAPSCKYTDHRLAIAAVNWFSSRVRMSRSEVCGTAPLAAAQLCMPSSPSPRDPSGIWSSGRRVYRGPAATTTP